MLVAIDAPHYCAGLVVKDDKIVRAAPIIAWSIGKKWVTVLEYFQRKGYKVYIYQGVMKYVRDN